MANTKIVQWNCNGLRAAAESSTKKLQFFDKEYPNANFTIAVFLETHHREEDDFPEQLNEYQVTHHLIHAPAPPDHPFRGIIVLVSKAFDIMQWKVKIPGRLLNINIKGKEEGKEFNLSAFYGPVQRDIKSAEVEGLIQNFFQLHEKHENNIILGDFNFIDNNYDKTKGLDGHDKMICRYWNDFKSKRKVSDPYREQYPSTKIFSYHNNNGKSRGDRVYISDNFVFNVSNMKYTYYPQANTHKLLSFEIESGQEKGPGYWKMNTSLLTDNNYIKLITDTITNFESFVCDDPSEWWDILHLKIRSLTVDFSRRKHFLENHVKREWINELTYFEALDIKSLSSLQLERLKTIQERIKLLEEQETEGHRIRTRYLPKYEHSDPNVSFYAKLEKRTIQKNVIMCLKDENGCEVNKSNDLMNVVSKFYTNLYSATKTCKKTQKSLLKNITRTFSSVQKDFLDAPITHEELEKAVSSLNDEKSPGLTGFPAEFYKRFWPLLKTRYLQFINYAFSNAFPLSLNTSVTTLIYKDKGTLTDIANYRPISLINTDIKILSKTLTNRLKPMLASVLHKSQSAVSSRQIDHTLHMIRDLIDMANQEDLEAAFIFLDQEKAFDRVDHEFLYQTMKAFGIGENFITWVKQLYHNPITRVKVNGFLTDPIGLARGVRQGDPLSFLLYLFNIELLGLQLRQNKNIVGFKVGGEKIISLHYADDTTICITQNRCFKEVIKDIFIFEQATGAKVNYGKTKGLWTGSWKTRDDSPLGIKWTSSNIFHLGVFVGNDDPAVKTFEQICPKIHKGLDYWKPFKFSVLSKARIIETFHASRLWYAARFYCIPPEQDLALQKAFTEYINFPLKKNTVNQGELQKLKVDGGLKLVNIKLKSEASKIKWLMSLCVNPDLSLHKALMERLLDTQRGRIHGINLFFTNTSFATRILRTTAKYYKEAIKAINGLDVKKQIVDIREENIFFNKTFLDANDKVLIPNQYCMNNDIYTYGQLQDEVDLRSIGERYKRNVTAVFDKIKTCDGGNRDDFVLEAVSSTVPFLQVTQKLIYETLLKTHVYKDHHSSAKWVMELDQPILGPTWEKMWNSIHNPLSSNNTKSAIWAQVHLNDYTTATFNKMFSDNDTCPLCTNTCPNRFHIILYCQTVVDLWTALEPFLKKVHPGSITKEEMAFGIIGSTPPVLLRNFLTFLLRECIRSFENQAFYYNLGGANAIHIQYTFNARVKREVMNAYQLYKSLNRIDYFFKSFDPNKCFLINVTDDVTFENIPKVFNV